MGVNAPLVLMSYGQGALDSFIRSIGRDPKELKVLLVITAALAYKKPVSEMGWLEDNLTELSLMGFQIDTYDIASKSTAELENSIADVDLLWISGGNTFYLLEQFRNTGFDKIIDEFVSDPAHIYAGVSAGAAVVGPDISFISPMDDPALGPSLKDTNGLNLVPNTVAPHLDLDESGNVIDQEWIEYGRRAKESDPDAIFIGDEQALIFQSGNREVVNSFPYRGV